MASKTTKKAQASPALKASVRDFCERTMNRATAARNNFVTSLMQLGGIDKATAERVTDLYFKLKVAKYSKGCDTINVAHGGFLDKDVILRAASECSQ